MQRMDFEFYLNHLIFYASIVSSCYKINTSWSMKKNKHYTRTNWKVYRLTKILLRNLTKWGLFFNSPPCAPHTFSFCVAVLGLHWSKKSSTVDMRSAYKLFSPPLYEKWLKVYLVHNFFCLSLFFFMSICFFDPPL